MKNPSISIKNDPIRQFLIEKAGIPRGQKGVQKDPFLGTPKSPPRIAKKGGSDPPFLEIGAKPSKSTVPRYTYSRISRFWTPKNID